MKHVAGASIKRKGGKKGEMNQGNGERSNGEWKWTVYISCA